MFPDSFVTCVPDRSRLGALQIAEVMFAMLIACPFNYPLLVAKNSGLRTPELGHKPCPQARQDVLFELGRCQSSIRADWYCIELKDRRQFARNAERSDDKTTELRTFKAAPIEPECRAKSTHVDAQRLNVAKASLQLCPGGAEPSRLR
jgi:hypothetical protein